MSRKYFSFCVLFLTIGVNAFCQKDYTLSVGTGIPLIGRGDRESFSYELDASLSKGVSSHLALGAGIGYLTNDKKPQAFNFTYDHTVFSAYLKSIYQINPRGKIIFQPEFRGGYAFYSSSFNEIIADTRYDNGFLIGLGINIRVPITKKISLNPMINCSEILKKEPPPRVKDVTNLIYNPLNIKIWEIGLGINIDL